MIKTIDFGSHEGKTYHLYTISNKNGMQVSITDLGAVITSIKVPVEGAQRELVLGFDKLEDYFSEKYLENYPYLGAVIGRNAGRISNSRFNIEGREISVTPNIGEHHLHGGKDGFDRKLWKLENSDENSLTLAYRSADGEEGYPGNVDVSVTYELNDDNELKVVFSADTDQPTVVNLTQHSYFNFNAENTGNILDHKLQVNSGEHVEVNEKLLPSGTTAAVEGSNYDYRSARNPESDLDNSFTLKDSPETAGTLESADGKVNMSVRTTQPVLHIYTGYYLPEIDTQGRKKMGQNAGICFETQGFADAPNHAGFPTTVLHPGQKYHHETIFKFDFTL